MVHNPKVGSSSRPRYQSFQQLSSITSPALSSFAVILLQFFLKVPADSIHCQGKPIPLRLNELLGIVMLLNSSVNNCFQTLCCTKVFKQPNRYPHQSTSVSGI
jgi:hypothetical protein